MLDRDQERYPPTIVLLSNGRQVTLQGLSLEDAGPLGDFHESLPRATYRFYGPYPLTRQSAARLAAEAGSPTLVALVAKTAGEIVGHAWYRWVDEDSRTSTFGICLRQEYRGIGLGRAMMERLLYIGEQNGPAVMSLTVQKANPRALALYHSMGFCEKREQMVKGYPPEMLNLQPG